MTPIGSYLRDPISSEEQAAAFINELALYNRQARLYSASHPTVSAAAEKVLQRLRLLTKTGERFNLSVARHAFMIGGEFLERQNTGLEAFAASLSDIGIITLTFSGELQSAELNRFAHVAALTAGEVWKKGGIKKTFAAAGITLIEVQGLDPSLFTLSEEIPTIAEIEKEGLLERFLRGLQVGNFPAPREKLVQMLAAAPKELADKLDLLMEGLSETTRLATLQKVAVIFSALPDDGKFLESHDKFLHNIVTFVTNLSPALRRDFLATFLMTLEDNTLFADDFFDQLPDGIVLDALNTVIAHKAEVPQLVLKLMHRLSLSSIGSSAPLALPQPTELRNKLGILLRKDQFEKFVPAAYQEVLAAILTSGGLAEAEAAELERLGKTLEQDHLEVAIAAVIGQILQILPAAEQGEGLRRNLGDLATFFLEKSDFAGLAGTCRMLKKVAGPGPGPPVFSPQLVMGVIDAASHSREHHPEIHAIIVTIGQPFLAPLLDRLGEENNRYLRRFYYDCLHDLGSMVRNAALERLHDDRWFVVRNLLVLLRSFPDQEVLGVVRRFMDHPHPKVRNEAVKTALYARDPVAERALLHDLTSRNAERQIAAVKLAELTRSQEVTDRLHLLLGTTKLGDYNLELKQAVVTTLAAIGNSGTIPHLERVLRSRCLFHPVQHGHLKLAIINTLGRYPAADVKPLIEEFAANDRTNSPKPLQQ